MIATAPTAYIKVITRQIFIKLFFTPAVVYDSRREYFIISFQPARNTGRKSVNKSV